MSSGAGGERCYCNQPATVTVPGYHGKNRHLCADCHVREQQPIMKRSQPKQLPVCDDCGLLPIVFLGLRGGLRRNARDRVLDKPARLCGYCVDRAAPRDANALMDRKVEVMRI